ncbi:MAG TPA: SdrD B-like domain-containing protein, partial [Saprospiraceae bacterium]|nr:SdrD B-like domain-containing protein [Saprospiraceae bacterium]
MGKFHIYKGLGMVMCMLCMGFIPLSAQSGRAFRDFDGNGLQTGAEPGVEGVEVRLYANATPPAKDQLIGTAITNASGDFNFVSNLQSGRAANPGERLRIEFTIPTSFRCGLEDLVDFTGYNANSYGSSIQFITGQQNNLRFALNYPGQVVTNQDPDVFLPCYVFGSPGQGGNVDNEPALVQTKFSWSGIPAGNTGGTPGVPGPIKIGTAAETGSLYGVAFSRQAQKVFASANLRRHSAMGPMGPGGIYLVDPYTANPNKVTQFLNLDAIGIPTQGAGPHPPNPMNNTSPVSDYVGTNLERGLPANKHTPSTDYAAGDQVGKVSLGDIDISDDGRYLYVMNLYDRRIYEIDLVTPSNPQAPTLADVPTRVRSWAVPNPATNAQQGEHRPWGLKSYRGKLYFGVVLSGQDINGNVVSPVNGSGNSQLGTQLRGYVYELNTNSSTFTVRLDFGFGYGRERSWIPWGYRQGFASRYFSGTEREVAEPVIADIEFDDEGNMLVGILDRKGHIYAINNNDFNGNLVDYEYSTAGELLRAQFVETPNGCVYQIVTRPGTADYYNDNLFHPESVQGPLAILPGSNQVLAVWLDPVNIRSGGTIRLNNVTGAQVTGSAYEITDDRFTLNPGTINEATPSKANALGDVELSGDPAPIEIGNRVWADLDRDGIQDANEPGLAGVTVLLKSPAGAVLATTSTSATGNYVFNLANVPDGNPDVAGAQPGLQPFTDYVVCIPATQFNAGQPLFRFLVADVDQNGVGLGDHSDSDGLEQPGGNVEINVTTGSSGENNHTYDFGFVPTDYGDLPDTYGTSVAQNGPWHYINTAIKLGGCVDGEINGQPEAMAGFMTGGDDNNAGPGSIGDCPGNGDDEDGITFSTPIVPGAQACVTVTAMNMTGAPVILQGWMDWNGNGTFDANEQLTTGGFAPAGAVVPVGGLNNIQICFTVPVDATFQGGALFSRFRISPNGGLSPNGGGIDGEVEDYKLPLAKIGNLVWRDYNYDGQQNEPVDAGIDGATVQLVWAGPDADINTTNDNRTYTTVTSTMGGVPGMYMFIGLLPGTYRVSIPSSPGGAIPTLINVGNPVTDSNNPAGVTVTIPNPISLPLNENGTGDVPNDPDFPDAQNNLTFDFGYVGFDYGDLPNSYGTTIAAQGPVHVISPNLYLGSCVDIEADGQPEAMAGAMTGGDDFTSGAAAMGTCQNGDDEDGIRFTPMVPGAQSCVWITAHNTTGASAILQAWVDWNGNGQFDAGEQLNTGDFAPSGAIIPNGGVSNQLFCFNVPANASFTSAQAMTRWRLSPAGGLTSGTPPGSTPPIGEIEDHKVPLAKVGNLVWEDLNGNGIQDEPASAGLNGIGMELIWAGPDGLVATTADNIVYNTTTSTMGGVPGMYMFTGLIPGTYRVSVSSIAPNYVPTGTLQGGNPIFDSNISTGTTFIIPASINLITGENGTGDVPNDPSYPDPANDLTYDFGYYRPAKVGDFVWHDINGNGLQDGNEPGIGNTAVILEGVDGLGNPVNTTTATDGTGMYMFGDLAPGTYKITFVTPAGGYVPTDDNVGGDDTIDSNADPDMGGMTLPFTVQSGDTIPTFDAGYYIPAAIGNYVWHDLNFNGVQEPGEPGLQGFTVVLTGTDGLGNPVSETLLTDVNGEYLFDSLVPGSYKLTFTAPVGSSYISTGLDQGGDDALDSDANPAMNGMTIFEVLESGEVNLTYDAGYYLPTSLGDLVWLDLNANGVQDPGEPGIAGVEVKLQNANGSPVTTNALGNPIVNQFTDANGFYTFSNLVPGDYKVMFINPDPVRYTLTAQNAGTNDAQDSDADPVMLMTHVTTLESGDHDPTLDAGLFIRAKVGDFVWEDLNGNGIQDPNEPGIENADVTLTGTDGQGNPVNITIQTDATGMYMFGDLIPGEYKITFSAPAGSTLVLTHPNEGNDDAQDSDADPANMGMTPVFTLQSGDTIPTFDAGYYVPAKVGDFVWEDQDFDGIQDPNEPVMSGVVVVLQGFDGAGNPVNLTTVTDATGMYMFGDLPPGEYKITFTTPTGFTPTLVNQGGDPALDNNADPAMAGMTPVFPVMSGDTIPTIDAGFVGAFDLALIKILAPGQPAQVRPGDTIHYRIRVINQGRVYADNILISDHVPAQMAFEAAITGNAAWTLAAPGLIQRTLSVANGSLPVGGLAPADSTEISVYLTLNSPLPAGLQVDNFAEITEATNPDGTPMVDVDSQYDDDPNNNTLLQDNAVNGNGSAQGEDDDHHDIASVTTLTYDLALIKLLANNQPLNVQPGDTIHYRIRVVNQGTIPANNILITDYVPANMTYETGIAGNVRWAVNGGLLQRTLTIADGDLSAGGLAPGQSVEVSLYLTLNSPLPASMTVRNTAEISGGTDENGDPQQDVDSQYDTNPNDDTTTADNETGGNGNNPGEDDDDLDYADIIVKPYDLALIKILAANQSPSVQPGDTIHYRIRVINQGQIPADNILITDYVPANMTYETGIAGNVRWAVNGGLLQRTLTIADGDLPAGGLAPGQQVEVSLYLTLNDPLPAGVTVRNAAEISGGTDENGDPQQDVDSQYDTNPNDDTTTADNETGGNGNNPGEDDDDFDYVDITVKPFDLALIKILAAGQSLNVQPGDTIHYRIRVVNQGQIPADNILISDYLPLNVLFFEPGINGNQNWSFAPNAVNYNV